MCLSHWHYTWHNDTHIYRQTLGLRTQSFKTWKHDTVIYWLHHAVVELWYLSPCIFTFLSLRCQSIERSTSHCITLPLYHALYHAATLNVGADSRIWCSTIELQTRRTNESFLYWHLVAMLTQQKYGRDDSPSWCELSLYLFNYSLPT